MERPFLERPTDLNDFFGYLLLYAPNFPPEDRYTNATDFAEAFKALDQFAASTKTTEGNDAVVQCKRHLQLAYEYYEKGDEVTGARTVQEVNELFRKARRFIIISDE